MSGGYFDRNIYAIGEIVASIERDIARALRPKPEKIHKDYWTIYVKDSFGSYVIWGSCLFQAMKKQNLFF